MVEKTFSGQNLCFCTFGANIRSYTKQRARHGTPFLQPPTPPSAGVHVTPPPPPQSNFQVAPFTYAQHASRPRAGSTHPNVHGPGRRACTPRPDTIGPATPPADCRRTLRRRLRDRRTWPKRLLSSGAILGGRLRRQHPFLHKAKGPTRNPISPTPPPPSAGVHVSPPPQSNFQVALW